MIKKFKHIISILLVSIFLTPMTIKLFDDFFHHHDYFVCTAKYEKHFHKFHEICPIASFDLSLFTVDKILFETQRAFYYDELYINNISNNCCFKSRYSFSLRAPPLSIYN